MIEMGHREEQAATGERRNQVGERPDLLEGGGDISGEEGSTGLNFSGSFLQFLCTCLD